MIESKGGLGEGEGSSIPTISTTTQAISSECCMCGDYGLSYELFRCKICQFRSQHRYCSNQYPKAESYKICNWCLNQKDDSANLMSSETSSSCKNSTDDDRSKKERQNSGQKGLRERRKAMQPMNSVPVKKVQRSISPERSPVSTGRKRIIIKNSCAVGERNHAVLRKSKSENQISNGGGVGGGGGGGGIITRQVYRNKVRRYKLLDEVSSQ